MSPLLALSGHELVHCTASAFDPKRHGRVTQSGHGGAQRGFEPLRCCALSLGGGNEGTAMSLVARPLRLAFQEPRFKPGSCEIQKSPLGR